MVSNKAGKKPDVGPKKIKKKPKLSLFLVITSKNLAKSLGCHQNLEGKTHEGGH